MSEKRRIVLDTNCLIAALSGDKFVDCAFAANATYIVSDDKHFDVLKDISFPQLLVLKLKEFLGLLQLDNNNNV
jgi:predicted nucleic acid-binding protein